MNKLQYKYLVGIDPGVKTGMAIYLRQSKKLLCVSTVTLIKAQDYLRSNFVKEICHQELLVRIEDARKRKWFGQTKMEVWQGAGSIKRDCSVWQEFLEFYSIPHEFVAPKNNKTKLDATRFHQLTGWDGPTNEHSRDAAVLVFGY